MSCYVPHTTLTWLPGVVAGGLDGAVAGGLAGGLSRLAPCNLRGATKKLAWNVPLRLFACVYQDTVDKPHWFEAPSAPRGLEPLLCSLSLLLCSWSLRLGTCGKIPATCGKLAWAHAPVTHYEWSLYLNPETRTFRSTLILLSTVPSP